MDDQKPDSQSEESQVKRLLQLAMDRRTPPADPIRDFWRINAGHLIGPLIAIVLSSIPAFIFAGRITEKVRQNESVSVSNAAIIRRMDEEGTKASQLKVQLDHQMIMSHENRIQRTEDAISSISVMKEQIVRMSEDLKSIKGRP